MIVRLHDPTPSQAHRASKSPKPEWLFEPPRFVDPSGADDENHWTWIDGVAGRDPFIFDVEHPASIRHWIHATRTRSVPNPVNLTHGL